MSVELDVDRTIAFLVDLLKVPSPTGYHEEALPFVTQAFEAIGLKGLALEQTRKGALIATIPGRSDSAPRVVSAHLDTIGAMVREVKCNGRLMLTQLGGYAWQSIESESVTVCCTRDGRRYRGTVQTTDPSVHTSSKMREGQRDEERMEVRLDAVTRSKEETLALGIDVGDFVFVDPRVEVTDTGFIKSRHLDDKASVAVIYGALQAMRAGGLLPAQRTTVLLCVHEEVGHGASGGLPADAAEMLAIDMAASTTGEHQNSTEYAVGICAKDSSGPYDLALRRRLVQLCERHAIPYRVDTYPHYGSDASAYVKAGGQARTGVIGPGVDASHAYERTHRDSLEATVRLLLHYLTDED